MFQLKIILYAYRQLWWKGMINFDGKYILTVTVFREIGLFEFICRNILNVTIYQMNNRIEIKPNGRR